MKTGQLGLTADQRVNAIQRLTALWAFTESGLGGIMHALRIPFTGLLVGGMAVIMISLIARLAEENHKQVLKSAMIVLIVKAMVSPHTPFPAYIAVSFQALLGYSLFRWMGVHFLSIVLLSTLAMLESAIQKILVLTLFFGQSIWKALDSMIAFLSDQFGSIVTNGSYLIVGIYLGIYLLGGFFIAWLAYRTIKSFGIDQPLLALDTTSGIDDVMPSTTGRPRKKTFRKLWVLVFTMIFLSAVLFVFAGDSKKGWLAVAKTVSWTVSAILVWYMLIGPLFTKAIQKILQKKESRYSDEVLKTLAFLPVLRHLTTLAWQQSKTQQGLGRWHFFFASLIHATLTYSETGKGDAGIKRSS